MTYEIERKILNNMTLADNEVYECLSYVCDLIRKDSDIEDPMDTNCKVCNETSEKFGRLMLLRFGCDVEQLNVKKTLQIPLTHFANFISFNVAGNKKTYLVDMTYSQFFGDSITLDADTPNSSTIISTEDIFGRIENESFVKSLRQNGFVELDEIILKQYIDSFLELCNVKDKTAAYTNVQKLLLGSRINLGIKK